MQTKIFLRTLNRFPDNRSQQLKANYRSSYSSTHRSSSSTDSGHLPLGEPRQRLGALLALSGLLTCAVVFWCGCSPTSVATTANQGRTQEVIRSHSPSSPRTTESEEPAVPDEANLAAARALLQKHWARLGASSSPCQERHLKIRSEGHQFALPAVLEETTDGRRFELVSIIGSLGYEQREVFDGERLHVRGPNGDVRSQGAMNLAGQKAYAAVRFLRYCDESAGTLHSLGTRIEDGQSYEGLRFSAPEMSDVDLWFDASGDLHHAEWRDSSLVRRLLVDEHSQFGDLRLPRRFRIQQSNLRNEDTYLVTSVELDASVGDELFQRPTPRWDATFPEGVSQVERPLSLHGRRHISVEAIVGTKRGYFVMDTGASTSVFDGQFLASMGITPQGEVSPTEGAFNVFRFARVPRTTVMGVSVAEQIGYVIDFHSPSSPVQIDGILGYDFFSRFDVTIDYPGGRLIFAPAGSHVRRENEIAVPIELYDTFPTVPVEIAGRYRAMFLVDTGNSGGIVVNNIPGVESILPAPEERVRWEIGARFASGSAPAFSLHTSMAVGQVNDRVTWQEAPLKIVDRTATGTESFAFDGNIGYDWLRHFSVTFSYQRQMMFLEQKIPFTQARHIGFLGLRLAAREGNFVVDDAAQGSPAQRSGLRAGDVILDVDGVQSTGDPADVEAILGQPIPGETRTIRIRRGEETLTFEVTASAHP